jgi:uncharacterized DUF497 family protein
MHTRFVWDARKAARNCVKHGVEFEEAQTCFADPWQIAFYDPDHGDDETRELLIGHSSRGRLLIVSYTLRGLEVRIISARKVTRTEAATYAQGI